MRFVVENFKKSLFYGNLIKKKGRLTIFSKPTILQKEYSAPTKWNDMNFHKPRKTDEYISKPTKFYIFFPSLLRETSSYIFFRVISSAPGFSLSFFLYFLLSLIEKFAYCDKNENKKMLYPSILDYHSNLWFVFHIFPKKNCSGATKKKINQNMIIKDFFHSTI